MNTEYFYTSVETLISRIDGYNEQLKLEKNDREGQDIKITSDKLNVPTDVEAI